MFNALMLVTREEEKERDRTQRKEITVVPLNTYTHTHTYTHRGLRRAEKSFLSPKNSLENSPQK